MPVTFAASKLRTIQRGVRSFLRESQLDPMVRRRSCFGWSACNSGPPRAPARDEPSTSRRLDGHAGFGLAGRSMPTRDTGVAMSQEDYLLASQPSELERLQLQSRVWEPAGRLLLSKVDGGSGARAADVGCGALGWLRILSEWVGPSGQVVGTDIDEGLLNAAGSFLSAEGISNVELVVDDLFDSNLDPQSFDLVHARYVIAPLGRGREQVAAYRRLVRAGGSVLLEEWDLGSWHFNPPAPAAERLIRLLSEIFAGLGGEAGRGLPEL